MIFGTLPLINCMTIRIRDGYKLKFMMNVGQFVIWNKVSTDFQLVELGTGLMNG